MLHCFQEIGQTQWSKNGNIYINIKQCNECIFENSECSFWTGITCIIQIINFCLMGIWLNCLGAKICGIGIIVGL